MYLGLDIGTTAVKAAVFSGAGVLLGLGTMEYTLETPAPDIVELDAEIYWQSTQEAVRQALAGANLSGSDIRALAVTGQVETLICVDAAGTPLRKAIVWLDNRAKAEANALAAQFDPEELFRMSGQTEMLPCWPAAKIAWLKRHEPELFARTAKFLMVEDYIVYRLAGTFVTCDGLLPSTLYFDIRTGGYAEAMLTNLGIAETQLPEVRRCGEALAVCNELLPGAVIGGAPLDHVAGNLGAGGGEPGVISETTGCTMALCVSSPGVVYDPARQISTYLGPVSGHSALLPWAPTAGMLLKYFRDVFAPELNYAQMDQLAAAVAPGSDGLIALPHAAGAISPVANPHARAVLYGLTLTHRKGHIVRAILEAVAYLLKDNLDALQAGGLPVREVRVLGGGAESRLWTQIKADVLGLPIVRTECREAACLGAAILGAAAAGDFADPAAAAQRMVRITERIEPGADASVYSQYYRQYQRINQLLMPTFGGES